jgi:hypothetical protein
MQVSYLRGVERVYFRITLFKKMHIKINEFGNKRCG